MAATHPKRKNRRNRNEGVKDLRCDRCRSSSGFVRVVIDGREFVEQCTHAKPMTFEYFEAELYRGLDAIDAKMRAANDGGDA